MKMYWRFFRFTILHKWYVFIECCKLGIPWRGLKHDMGKFRPKMFKVYARRYYAGNAIDALPDLDYLNCFSQHLRRSDHHWQYWVYVRNNGTMMCLPMSNNARKELLADLRGSSLFYVTDVSVWYENHKQEFHMESETRKWLENQLGIINTHWESCENLTRNDYF